MVEDSMEEHRIELRIAKGQGCHTPLDKTRIVQTVRKNPLTCRSYRMRIDVDARRRSGGFCQDDGDGPRTTAHVQDVHGIVEKRQDKRSGAIAALALKIEDGVAVPHGGGRTIRRWGSYVSLDQTKAPVLTVRAGALEF